MAVPCTSLMDILNGWDGYQSSLTSALGVLSIEQLRYRPCCGVRSVGEIAAHIAFGRLDWFNRMGAPGAAELVGLAADVWQPWAETSPVVTEDAAELVRWLTQTWNMIEQCLTGWTIDDLSWSYRQQYGGKVYLVSRQWVVWRIMSHDIHHGGQLSILLAEQGLYLPELGENGGHIIPCPVVESDDIP